MFSTILQVSKGLLLRAVEVTQDMLPALGTAVVSFIKFFSH